MVWRMNRNRVDDKMNGRNIYTIDVHSQRSQNIDIK